ncbi:GNAT family N-acetyltransferase [Janthinobacterium sp.]|uniref:GNAT family N-acetyltransferase n=1 Tax=Janthinobacterium sp. TaxID=1871054 RepID=UPI00293D7D16|nr:GNAT family N-acetyltransferase [Janthinobacterium sp.]
MADAYQLSLEAEPGMDDIRVLLEGLTAFNAEKNAGAAPEYLLASVRDGAGVLAGGLFGATYLGWLQVQVVWLPDALRAHGHGRALMDLAEAEALRRGCARSFVETFSFQALGFYENCGYKIFSALADFPPGGARYALTKDLAP